MVFSCEFHEISKNTSLHRTPLMAAFANRWNRRGARGNMEECETKVQRLLSEELDINDVVIESAHRVKGYSHEKKNSKKS